MSFGEDHLTADEQRFLSDVLLQPDDDAGEFIPAAFLVLCTVPNRVLLSSTL